MKNNNILEWTFNSHIHWIRDLAFLIKSKLAEVPEIIVQTIGLETTFQSLFFKCEMNKENLLKLRSLKSISDWIDSINVAWGLKIAGKNLYYCNDYELDKELTVIYINNELGLLRVKCENKNAKSKIKSLEIISEKQSVEIATYDRVIRELRGETENKDATIGVQNSLIVKLRKGIDEEGGLDKLKSLIDKCYKGTATKPEQLQAKYIVERIA